MRFVETLLDYYVVQTGHVEAKKELLYALETYFLQVWLCCKVFCQSVYYLVDELEGSRCVVDSLRSFKGIVVEYFETSFNKVSINVLLRPDVVVEGHHVNQFLNICLGQNFCSGEVRCVGKRADILNEDFEVFIALDAMLAQYFKSVLLQAVFFFEYVGLNSVLNNVAENDEVSFGQQASWSLKSIALR